METKGLLFIPDISGFTRFINETEVGHGRLIIQELLEIIIHSNSLDLQISEIEGDAILFYKFGEPPLNGAEPSGGRNVSCLSQKSSRLRQPSLLPV